MTMTFNRVTKRFGNKTAVNDFNAVIPSGVHGLLGPNGAGKTTLMRLMAGVLTLSGGEILLDDMSISEMGNSYRARLGYLPQLVGYYPYFTAIDFLLYMASVKGLSKPYAMAEAEELLSKVRLLDEKDKKIKTFSGGMKQRLGIAQALQGKPDILILDEPTAGLDPKERIFFRNLLSDYAQNKLVLLSTHIVADIESIASNVLVMKKGQLLTQGSPDEILKKISGMVWECTLPIKDVENMRLKYPVTSFRHENGNAFIRIVAEKAPCENAVSVHAGLEDLYLHYFFDEEGILDA